jgi:transcription elongation factor Elf1
VDEEELIIWQDVLDQVAARRADQLACPHCGATPLAVEDRPTGVTRISCATCGRYIEGRFA